MKRIKSSLPADMKKGISVGCRVTAGFDGPAIGRVVEILPEQKPDTFEFLIEVADDFPAQHSLSEATAEVMILPA